MSPRIPPPRRRRSGKPLSIEEFVRREEEIARWHERGIDLSDERDERPFDPYVPPERYAQAHHFAVNGTPSRNDWFDDVEAELDRLGVRESWGEALSDEELAEWRQAFESGLSARQWASVLAAREGGYVSNPPEHVWVTYTDSPAGADLDVFAEEREVAAYLDGLIQGYMQGFDDTPASEALAEVDRTNIGELLDWIGDFTDMRVMAEYVPVR